MKPTTEKTINNLSDSDLESSWKKFRNGVYFFSVLHFGFEILTNNQIGLLMSFIFALLVVIFTGLLEKKRFKLKL